MDDPNLAKPFALSKNFPGQNTISPRLEDNEHEPHSKRVQVQLHPQSISSTMLANNVMKFRLGGSVSDPLNLQGGVCVGTDDNCSSHAPSTSRSDEPPQLPPCFHKDPLNIEGHSVKLPISKEGPGM